MNVIFKLVLTDKIIKWSFTIAAILLGLEITYIAIVYFSLPPVLPLFNQMPWGDSRLGTRIEILLPVIITIAFFLINYFLLARLYVQMPLISRILSITTLLVTILSFIFIVRTLLLIL